MPHRDLSVREALAGRGVLLTGATGFIGKVILAFLLDRLPGVGRIFVLARPKPGQEAAERLLRVLRESSCLAPLRQRLGDGFERLLMEKLEVLSGDAAEPAFGLSDESVEALVGRVDAIINVAGLVDLNPALDESLRVNAYGARHAAALAVRLGARLVHMSTAYVAGLREGQVGEEPPAGYRPKPDASELDAEKELAECSELIARVKAEAGEGRRARRAAEARLIKEGRRRAHAWGWPNAYCYAKALGEQLIVRTPGLSYAIVRPAIVESALTYPLPGWNEGFNTSAPVILAMCTGHLLWPAHPRAALDVVPVDFVAAATIAVCGAALLGEHKPVYHLGTSDTNPLSVRRCMAFVGEYRRRAWRDHAPGLPWLHWLRTRGAVMMVRGGIYRAFGVPAYRKLVGAVARSVGCLPARAKNLERIERQLGRIEHVVETFYPFIHDIDCVFKTDAIRELYRRLPQEERELLPWAPESLRWRHYWFDVHTEGLRRWVFPGFQARRPAPRRTWWERLGRGFLRFLQTKFFTWIFSVTAEGRENVPTAPGFLVVANHQSHLDMGLIKRALGPAADELYSLAAKDYFFDHPLKRFYFTHFTNLIPFNRSSALKESLQAAAKVLRAGGNLLIFPEGTRTKDGRIAPFKPAAGYLALNNGVPVLPVYLEGAYEAMPKGAWFPRRRPMLVRVGPLIPCEALRRAAAGLSGSEAYRAATLVMEQAVRALEGQAASPVSAAKSVYALTPDY